jgi:hypothetical protein
VDWHFDAFNVLTREWAKLLQDTEYRIMQLLICEAFGGITKAITRREIAEAINRTEGTVSRGIANLVSAVLIEIVKHDVYRVLILSAKLPDEASLCLGAINGFAPRQKPRCAGAKRVAPRQKPVAPAQNNHSSNNSIQSSSISNTNGVRTAGGDGVGGVDGEKRKGRRLDSGDTSTGGHHDTGGHHHAERERVVTRLREFKVDDPGRSELADIPGITVAIVNYADTQSSNRKSPGLLVDKLRANASDWIANGIPGKRKDSHGTNGNGHRANAADDCPLPRRGNGTKFYAT